MATLDEIKNKIATYTTLAELVADVVEGNDTDLQPVTDDLVAINDCKKDIKAAVNEKKSGTIVDTDTFPDYADRIRKMNFGIDFAEGMTVSYWTNGNTKSLVEALEPDWTEFSSMFRQANGVDGVLDLSGWKASPTNMSYMFYSADNVTKLIMDGWNFTAAPSLNNAFGSMDKLESISLDGANCAGLESDSTSFAGTENLSEILMPNTSDASKSAMLAALNNGGLSGWYIKGDNLYRFGIGYAGGTLYVHTTNAYNSSISFSNSSSTYKYSSPIAQKITNMQYLFRGTNASGGTTSGSSTLTKLDIRRLDTSAATKMDQSLCQYPKLKVIDGIEDLDTSSATTVAFMFSQDNALEDFVPKWNLGKCTTAANLFTHCYALEHMDLSKVTTSSSLVDITYMFYCCYRLRDINLTGWNLNAVTNYNYAFSNCYNLRQITIGEMNSTGRSVINKAYSNGYFGMPDHTGRTTSTSDTTRTEWFPNRIYIKSTAQPQLRVNGNTSAWSNCSGSSTYGYFYNFSNSQTSALYLMGNGQSTNNATITSIDASNMWGSSDFKSAYYAFGRLPNLERIEGCQYLPLGACTNIAYMFAHDYKLKSLDMTTRVTSSTTSMSDIFRECKALEEVIGIETWDVSGGTDFGSIFRECNVIESLDLSGWVPSAVTACSAMFYNCNKLRYLDMSSWVTTKLTTYTDIFYGCNCLEYVKVANCTAAVKTWLIARLSSNGYTFALNASGRYLVKDGSADPDLHAMAWTGASSLSYSQSGASKFATGTSASFTDVLTTMDKMFINNIDVKTLDLSAFDMTDVTDTTMAFMGNTSLTTLTLGNIRTSKVTAYADMFKDCPNLKTVNVSLCTGSTKEWLIGRLAEAGYTFELNSAGDALVKSE